MVSEILQGCRFQRSSSYPLWRSHQCIVLFSNSWASPPMMGAYVRHIQQGIQLGQAGTLIAKFLLLQKRLLQFLFALSTGLAAVLDCCAVGSRPVAGQQLHFAGESFAGSIITQFCRVRCLANKVGMEYLFQRFIFDCDFKACIVTYRHRFRCPHCCTDKPQQRLTCILALVVGPFPSSSMEKMSFLSAS